MTAESREIEAIYEGGVFRPMTPVELPEHQLVVVVLPDDPEIQESSSFWRAPKLDVLARQQSVKPFKFDSSRESFWPEDESIDDFIAAVRRWRSGEE